MRESAGIAEAAVLRPQLPVVLPLAEKRRETRAMTTLFFPRPESRSAKWSDAPPFTLSSFVPGQFLMVWLPGLDEKPYTVSYLEEGRFGLTVLKRGVFSGRLHALEIGAQVGFRGPYGRGFRDAEDSPRVVLMAGGCGVATVALLKERLPRSVLVQGAPTADEVLYGSRFAEQIVFTEDGSAGLRGLPTQWLSAQAETGEIRKVFTCGPEAMLREVVAICARRDIECQAALERYMKCGIGLCGQCECDGRLVCLEGPVFSRQELETMPSFGSNARLKSGARVPLAEYGQCRVSTTEEPSESA